MWKLTRPSWPQLAGSFHQGQTDKKTESEKNVRSNNNCVRWSQQSQLNFIHHEVAKMKALAGWSLSFELPPEKEEGFTPCATCLWGQECKNNAAAIFIKKCIPPTPPTGRLERVMKHSGALLLATRQLQAAAVAPHIQ